MDKKKVFLKKSVIILLIFLIGGLNITQCLGFSYKNDITKPPETTIDNYLFKNLMKLDDFHDVGIKKITSPSNPYDPILLQSPEVYIQPGTEDIELIVENNGTYPEYNLSCFAEIYEYITDPINGTLVYEDEIAGIDLDEPYGGTNLLNFNSYTFANEGLYSLIVDLPLDIDDFPENNQRELIIGVDDTEPECDPPILDPSEPDGWNGWYVSCVNVTVSASDEGSGVKEIRYTVLGGLEEIINGDNVTFMVCEDGENLIEYWAVDWVGNVESPKNFLTINIDRTPPEVGFTYEIIGGNPWQGWEVELTATAVDAVSGICRVEFYFNDELQETVDGSGPEYVWTLRYWPIPKAIFKVRVYDCAGNYAEDFINGSDIKTSYRSNFYNRQSQNLWRLWLFDRFSLLEVFLRIINL